MNYKNVYISGKITGNENYKAEFAKRATELKRMGFYPINPVKIYERLKIELGREPTYDEIMTKDIKELKNCEYINFLDGWEKSEGARKEYSISVENNIKVLKIYLLSDKW